MMVKKQKKHFTFTLFISLLILSFISGSIGGILSYQYLNLPYQNLQKPLSDNVSTVVQETYIEESSVIDTVKKVSPAVVSVVVSKDVPSSYQGFNSIDPFEDLFNDPFFGFPNFEFRTPNRNNSSEESPTEKRVIGGGSGFIFSTDGLVVTNKHVVEDLQAEYSVILNDGTEYSATILGRDPLNDLAVLQIQAEEESLLPALPTLDIGNSSDLKVGQKVVAIGNALAEYENTVTVGVISAKGRNIVAGGSLSGAESLNNLLQTDAAINPGNSGGPLCNLAGEVIGINVAVASNANGISFAIPIDDAKQVIESVQEYGRIVRPMLGIRYVMVNAENKEDLELGENFQYTYGALITGDPNTKKYAVIPGSPADKAGLMRDDVILEVNQTKLESPNTLKNIASTHQIGEMLQLKVWRAGELLDIEVELGEIDENKEMPQIEEQ